MKLIKNALFVQDPAKENQIFRDQWVEAALKNVKSGSLLLDAGAGEGRYRKFCQHLTYVAQDFSSYDGKGDTSGLQTGSWSYVPDQIISDISSIPVATASFDAILCTEVLEHIPEPISALKEFSRILKPNGHLIMTAPVACLTHMAPYFFYSGFSRYWYEKFLQECGFEILELVPNGNYFSYVAQEVTRIGSISESYLLKKLSFYERVLVMCLRQLLFRLSKNDSGDRSSELVCFGFHVRARKL